MPRELTKREKADARNTARELLAAEAAALLLWRQRQAVVIASASWLTLEEVSQRLHAALVRQIADTRNEGAQAGVRALKRELSETPIGSAGLLVGLPLIAAAQTAKRYVARFFGVAESSGLPKQAAAQEAASQLQGRAGLIMATENSIGFSGARRNAAKRAAKAMRGDGTILLERWDAVLDHNVCEKCEFADGETIRVGESFSEGIPGAVHPRCRCTSHYLYATAETEWLLTG